ncbi:DUF177 domain-containing protein, partial [Bacteroidales bacterium MSK.15.36]|nr:DUF177 domain-containing protein [Bacteroidales bacterium MSK.15.36]
DIDVTIKSTEFEHSGEIISFLAPIHFMGSMTNVENTLVLEGLFDTRIELSCSRCLDNIKKEMEVKVRETFTANEADKDGFDIFIDNNIIDMMEVIENNIITILPVKKLCKEDCKGLCPKCGTNLNYNKCNCEKDDNID